MLHLLVGAAAHHRKPLLLAMGAVLLLFWFLLGDYDRFTVYRSYASLTARQDTLGYAFAGRFGNPDWPAAVVDRQDGDGEITFTLANGIKHQYRGFGGHMKVLTLRSGFSNTFVLVFTEKPKKIRRPLRR